MFLTFDKPCKTQTCFFSRGWDRAGQVRRRGAGTGERDGPGAVGREIRGEGQRRPQGKFRAGQERS